MKKARKLSILFSILIVTGMLFVLAGCGSGSGDGSGTIGVNCIDVSGTWKIIDVNDSTDCEGGGVFEDFSTSTFTQNGCTLTIMDDDDPEAHTETISGSTVNFNSEWEEDGGTVTSTGSVTFSGDTLSGTQNWTWSDGTDTCSGTMTITGTKQ